MSEKPLGVGTTNQIPNSLVVLTSNRLTKPWSLSKEGVKFIAVLESGIMNGTFKGLPVQDGFILQAYDDGYGYPTVGLGHKIQKIDNLRLGEKISLERAKNIFSQDIKTFERSIHAAVKVPLHQHEYDAITSVIFNTGFGRAKEDPWPGSRIEYLANSVNGGNYEKMPELILGFIAKRVPARRKREAELFKTGAYNAAH